MNYKQKLFADAYLVSFSPAKAAREAGYSERTAAQQGYALLQKEEIKNYVAEAVANRQKAMQRVPFESILSEMVEIAMNPEEDKRVRLKAADILLKWETTGRTPTDNADVQKFVDALKEQIGDVWQ